jgi:AcrR family transcriptional regulator
MALCPVWGAPRGGSGRDLRAGFETAVIRRAREREVLMAVSSRVPRTSADERRRQAVVQAVDEFARRGLRGGSTRAIAARCGVSEPYLFRLFQSKRALFGEALDHVLGLLADAQDAALPDLSAAASARGQVLRGADGQIAKLLLQGYAAACDDQEIADLLHHRVHRLTAGLGETHSQVRCEILHAAAEALSR